MRMAGETGTLAQIAGAARFRVPELGDFNLQIRRCSRARHGPRIEKALVAVEYKVVHSLSDFPLTTFQ